MSSDELDHLRSENAELRRRLEAARTEIDELRAEVVAAREARFASWLRTCRRWSVAALSCAKWSARALSIPTSQAWWGVALRKIGRGPRKAFRLITRGQ